MKLPPVRSLKAQQMLVKAIFPNNEDRIQFSLQLLSALFFTQFDG